MAIARGNKTISAAHVLDAMRELDFPPAMRKELREQLEGMSLRFSRKQPTVTSRRRAQLLALKQLPKAGSVRRQPELLRLRLLRQQMQKRRQVVRRAQSLCKQMRRATPTSLPQQQTTMSLSRSFQKRTRMLRLERSCRAYTHLSTQICTIFFFHSKHGQTITALRHLAS